MVAIDQAVKAWARHTFATNTDALGGAPWPGVFEFTFLPNRGIAFGLLQGEGRLMTPVALIMAGASGYYSFKNPKETALSHITAGLLAAGALGNLYDRVVYGQVTDMFFFRAINFPVFNVADACITVAAVLLIVGWLLEGLRKPVPTPPSTTPIEKS